MQQSSFNLTRQFALLSFITILLIGAVSAYLLSRLFTEKILTRDATVSQEFIDSIVAADGTWRFFADTQNPDSLTGLQEFFDHVAHMPDVVRANVYGLDQSVLWSSEFEIIGQRFPDNEELEATLLGKVIFESGIIGETEKQEHQNLGPEAATVPVRHRHRRAERWRQRFPRGRGHHRGRRRHYRAGQHRAGHAEHCHQHAPDLQHGQRELDQCLRCG